MALTLPKKSDASVVVVPPWHPDLRNADLLPDTKVVRTAFFVNGIAIVAAVALALYLGIQEWKLFEVKKQINAWQKQIDNDKKESADDVALYGQFKLEAAKTAEVDAFIHSKPIVSEIILRLGTITPKKIAFDSLDFRDTGLSIRATIKGAPDRSSGDASAYEKLLRTDKQLGPLFSEVNLLTMHTNPASGRLQIEILCVYKKGAKKA
jgi:hypothetical protein